MDPNMRKSFYLAPCGELNKKKKSTIAQVVDDKIQENADKSREQVINDEEAQEDNLDDKSIEQQVVNDEKVQEHSLDDNSTIPQVVNLDEAHYHPLLLDVDDSIEPQTPETPSTLINESSHPLFDFDDSNDAHTPETPSTLVNETSDDETDSELDISICSSIELNVSKDESE